MSILEALGAAPSSFTVPLTVATVAGSMGVAAGVAAGADEGALEDFSVFFNYPQATESRRHKEANITSHVLVQFMMSPFRVVLEQCKP